MAAIAVVAHSIIAVALLANVALSDAYTNHTVGGVAGWFFNSATNKTSADFKAWAAKQTFNLGDFLIFNTSTNQTVIQTYSKTTYINCTTDESSDNDTFQYNGGNSKFGVTMIIPVALTMEGRQYYFSEAQDGQQCLNGMAFEIKVNHGTGLPPSFNQPPPPPYASPPTATTTADGRGTAVTNLPPDSGSSIGAKACWLSIVLVVLATFGGLRGIC